MAATKAVGATQVVGVACSYEPQAWLRRWDGLYTLVWARNGLVVPAGLHPVARMAIMDNKSSKSHPMGRISAVTAGSGTRLLALLSALFSNTP